MNKINLSSPWANYCKEVEALFKEDKEVSIVFDNQKPEIKLFVGNPKKASALEKLLPKEKNFGNVTLKITIVPGNEKPYRMADVFEDAFKGNPALAFVKEVPVIVGAPVTYVIFAKKVVQYFNDDLHDLYGLKSTLYQDIAKNVFNEFGDVFYGTAKTEKEESLPFA